jgi:hypothetical protein
VNGRKIMKIGTLLTAAIVSLSAVGGGLAVYIAVTKYETMSKVSEAQARLQIVRTLGDIPRYLNSERGFASCSDPARSNRSCAANSMTNIARTPTAPAPR